MVNAQAKSKNAWLASQQAALLAFKSGLLADEAMFDAQRLRTSELLNNEWFSACIGFQQT